MKYTDDTLAGLHPDDPGRAALYEQIARRLASRILRDPDEAHSLAGRSMEKAVRTFARCPEGTHFRSWLVTTLHSTFMALHGSSDIAAVIAMRTAFPDRRRWPHGPSRSWSNVTSRRYLQAVATLSALHREVLTRTSSGTRYRAVARVLSISERRIATVLCDTRQKLEEYLSQRVTATNDSSPQPERHHVRRVVPTSERACSTPEPGRMRRAVVPSWQPLPPRPDRRISRLRILFLASSPTDQARLAIADEWRLVEDRIRTSRYREEIALFSRWATRTDDLQQALLEIQPHIVHFSGHGESDGIYLQQADGTAQKVPAEALARVFDTFKDDVRIVVFNACFSAEYARIIAEHIAVAVGMRRVVEDEATRAFVFGFYSGLGYGRSVQDAFKIGISQVVLEGHQGYLEPRLLTRRGLRASDIKLV